MRRRLAAARVASSVGASATTDATYASSTSGPSTVQPFAARGTDATDGTCAISAAIAASAGGTIWAPWPESVTTRPPR